MFVGVPAVSITPAPGSPGRRLCARTSVIIERMLSGLAATRGQPARSSSATTASSTKPPPQASACQCRGSASVPRARAMEIRNGRVAYSKANPVATVAVHATSHHQPCRLVATILIPRQQQHQRHTEPGGRIVSERPEKEAIERREQRRGEPRGEHGKTERGPGQRPDADQEGENTVVCRLQGRAGSLSSPLQDGRSDLQAG